MEEMLMDYQNFEGNLLSTSAGLRSAYIIVDQTRCDVDAGIWWLR